MLPYEVEKISINEIKKILQYNEYTLRVPIQYFAF